MRQPLITLGLLGVLAWLLWERHQSAESVDDEITHLRRALEDGEADLDACQGTLARSEAALTRQRADTRPASTPWSRPTPARWKACSSRWRRRRWSA